MSGSRWVITPSRFSGSWRSSLYILLCVLTTFPYYLLLLLGPNHFCPLLCPSLHEIFSCMKFYPHLDIALPATNPNLLLWSSILKQQRGVGGKSRMGWDRPDAGHGGGSPGKVGRSPREGPATTTVRVTRVSVPFPRSAVSLKAKNISWFSGMEK